MTASAATTVRGRGDRGARASAPLVPSTSQRAGVSAPYLPKRVERCSNQPQPEGSQAWRYWTWKREGGAEPKRHAHKCRSWRCQGECSKSLWAEDWRRIHSALNRYPVENISFLVLTLDRYGTITGVPWDGPQEAYRELSRLTRNFLARLKRLARSAGAEWDPSAWVATVEAHRSGWPHLNLVIANEWLAGLLREEAGKPGHGSFPWLAGDLATAALEVGWGPKSGGAPAQSKEAIAGYIAKLAGEQGDVTGEIAKMTQAPVNAAMKLRRIRSGKGFLPPRKKDDTATGMLISHAEESVVTTMGDHGEARKRESAVAWRARMRRYAYFAPEGDAKDAARRCCAILAERVPRGRWRQRLRRTERALEALGDWVELWPRARESEAERAARMALEQQAAAAERRIMRMGGTKSAPLLRLVG